MRLASILVVVGVVAAAAACSNDPVLPDVSKAKFVDGVDNELMPLPQGAAWHYDEGGHDIDVVVKPDAVDINGVNAVAVQDTDSKDGVIFEDTTDFFAQDEDGAVWYLGEDTCEFTDGECDSTEGSWRYGKDGGLPGIIMPAHPAVDGVRYYQEFLKGHAEDVGEVIAVDVHVDTDVGSFDHCIETHDTSTLETSADEKKDYCPGVGVVVEKDGDKVAATIKSVEGLNL